MKKILFIIFLLFLGLGCKHYKLDGNNELVVTNRALASVTLNFRGTSHPLSVGETKTISYIGSGSYDYETAVTVPSGADSVTLGEHLADTLVFTGETKVTIFYTSSLLDGVYEVSAAISTSNSNHLL